MRKSWNLVRIEKSKEYDKNSPINIKINKEKQTKKNEKD